MKNKKILKEDKISVENSYNELLSIYNNHFGDYKPRESQNNPVSKESDMGEGKLFTKFVLKK